MSGLVCALAGRLRLTEGQLYSSTLTIVMAALLATGLGDVHGVVSSSLSQPPLELAPAASLPPVAVPTAPPAVPVRVPGPVALPPFVGGGVPFPVPQPAPAPSSPVTTDPAPTQPPTDPPTPTPTASPCAAKPADDAVVALIKTLDDAAGGDLPDEDLVAALHLITGCSTADPAVVAIGLLIGIGQTLPDPGLPDPPVIPTVDLPDEVVAALQPARAAIDELCGLVGTGQAVASLFLSAYPRPIAPLTTQVLFQALSVCGQVRNP